MGIILMATSTLWLDYQYLEIYAGLNNQMLHKDQLSTGDFLADIISQPYGDLYFDCSHLIISEEDISAPQQEPTLVRSAWKPLEEDHQMSSILSIVHEPDEQFEENLSPTQAFGTPQKETTLVCSTWKPLEEDHQMSSNVPIIHKSDQQFEENSSPSQALRTSQFQLNCIRRKKIAEKAISKRKRGRPIKEKKRTHLQAKVKDFLSNQFIKKRACQQNKEFWDKTMLKWYNKIANLPEKQEFKEYLENYYDDDVLAASFTPEVKEELLAMQLALLVLINQCQTVSDLSAILNEAERMASPLREGVYIQQTKAFEDKISQMRRIVSLSPAIEGLNTILYLLESHIQAYQMKALLSEISETLKRVRPIFKPMSIRRTRKEVSQISFRVRGGSQDIEN